MKFDGLSESQQRRIEAAIKNVAFASLVGIEVESVGPGIASMSLEVRDVLRQNNGVVHGGAIATLIDSVAAFAVIPLLADNETTTTIDLTINYIRPLRSGTATASARVLREGERIIFLSIEVLDDSGMLAASGLTTYLRLARRPNKT